MDRNPQEPHGFFVDASNYSHLEPTYRKTPRKRGGTDRPFNWFAWILLACLCASLGLNVALTSTLKKENEYISMYQVLNKKLLEDLDEAKEIISEYQKLLDDLLVPPGPLDVIPFRKSTREA